MCGDLILNVTGSGKTLAYLAPVMQQLKHEEETVGVMARVKRPRAIILCPSRELASQVLVSMTSCVCRSPNIHIRTLTALYAVF